ncbi:DUF4134 domain-containing protein [Bacteroides xylanisolvens]|uniref:DUF4134 family protein n=1 Tax=Bacteroides xylanisolvens TaxID=371601 RepID=UPI001CDC0C36|nr:DUF4134 family protein [Bacteroides xylanisolvens]MCA4571585.1 DUF4134 domain-containing protein [Bacteroides xylanisolvens]
MFFGTFWEHHTYHYICHILIIKHLNTILCYSEEIAKYVPIVVKLCYAIAGVVAVVGAISVYIAMNNEEQDVKNILVLRNAFEKTRKQMKVNTLSINTLTDFANFPMLANLTLKKT